MDIAWIGLLASSVSNLWSQIFMLVSVDKNYRDFLFLEWTDPKFRSGWERCRVHRVEAWR